MIRLFSPKYYQPICRFLYHRLPPFTFGLFLFLCYWILFSVPQDINQGLAFKWIYVHVPCAFASMALYLVMALCSILKWVYHIKVAGWISSITAKIGCLATALAISSGSIWGYYTWGVMWVWDPRLTTELMMLMLYLAFILADQAAVMNRSSYKLPMVIGVIGVFNLPLIHYSVVWWQSLHQGSTLLNLSNQTMPWDMLWPLMLSILTAACAIVSIVAARILHNTKPSCR